MSVVPLSYLARRNPTVKAALVFALSLVLVMVLDPITPLLFIAVTLVAGLVLGRIPLGAYLRALFPLLIVGLGFVSTNALFAVTAEGDVVHTLGPLRLSERGVIFGLAIALRGLAIGALSVTFILTTDPTDLAVSLVRHARLPFRIVYALLAGYRFLPYFTAEYAQVRLAQRLRGGERSGLLRRLTEPARLVLPLLALAIRRATRIGVAMDSRGFSAASPATRTTYRRVPLGWGDALLTLLITSIAGLLVTLSATAGWLRFWDGRFAA
ncbi:MAG TPA: energy-coupling factor transporter transmembrane component T [Chloroflexota bacterium]|jgi:energy-coupling factor transport system permease protein|nr:energy-coupling factor transporter transmembrane component T [Chloroflexota bacterium]